MNILLIYLVLIFFVMFLVYLILESKLVDLSENEFFECGFDSLTFLSFVPGCRFMFMIYLYLVFDMEVAMLIPLLNMGKLFSLSSFFCLLIFFISLTLFYYFEWALGSFDW